MPTYEYKCKCGHYFERTYNMLEMKQAVKCPECGKQAKRAICNRSAVIRQRLGSPRIGRGRGK